MNFSKFEEKIDVKFKDKKNQKERGVWNAPNGLKKKERPDLKL